MEEKILNELKNINLQLQAFDSKLDEKLKIQKEEICSELREEFKKDLNTVRQEFKEDLNTVRQELRQEFKEDLNTIRQEFKEDLNTVRQEFKEDLNSNLEELKTYIISETSKAFREHMDVIYDRKNKEHHEIVEELREHKVRTLKGVRAFERSLTV